MVLYLWCILFTGCKESVKTKQFAPKFLMEQVLLSSEVYHSSVCSLGLYDAPILVYRYSGNMCHSCIIENLMELRDFQERTGKDHILVLPAFPEDRGGKARLNTELADFNYLNISPDSLALPIHEIEGAKPYFAVLNSDGKLEMVFFPQAGRPEITQAYFREVEKRIKAQ